jgi:hypothetical protein
VVFLKNLDEMDVVISIESRFKSQEQKVVIRKIFSITARPCTHKTAWGDWSSEWLAKLVC